MKKAFLIFAAFLILAGLTLAASKPVMEDVASKLSCYCGTCPHLVVTECGCGTADQIKKDIQKMIDQGMTKDQIIKSYIDQYGQTVLSAPPKSGFNLTAWVLPFAAFALGGTLLFTFLKRQQVGLPAGTPPPAEPPASDPEEAHYRKMLEKELDQRR